MNIQTKQGNIQNSNADTIIVNLFDDVITPSGATGAVDHALDGAISDLIAAGDLTGKMGEVGVIYPRGAMAAKRVLIVGLGKRDTFDLEAVRQASAAAIKHARALNGTQVASIVHGAGVGGLDVETAVQATIESALLALYTYDADKKKEPSNAIETLTLVEMDADKMTAVENGVKTAVATAAGTILARDLVNMPPNIATPQKLADTAKQIAHEHGMKLIVGGRKWAKKRKMGAFLAVAQGAGFKPKFIVLEHNADRDELDTIVLVGKGITFDTGGISIKPSANMGLMKSDMGGAAAVLGAMKTVGILDIPLHVVGIVPATENMPDADAYRPADIIKASNGKTIEIISTDAEGRMVLADGLVYAANYKPKAVIDLATLTGASIIAMGLDVSASMFSNDAELRGKLMAASDATRERLWHLPLWEEYRRTIDSDVADMKNGGGRYGGVGTSAVFLQEFTDYAWAHLDIASMAFTDKNKGYITKGGTGFGARLLVQFLRSWP